MERACIDEKLSREPLDDISNIYFRINIALVMFLRDLC